MVARVTALVGWCLTLALCQVKGSYIPADMNRTIQNLLDHYVSTGRRPDMEALVFRAGCEGNAPRRSCD